MLSRVAESLFWIGRYVERAENIARLVDAARRMTALPSEASAGSNEWASVLVAVGAHEVFGDTLDQVDSGTAIHRLIFDTNNPSSVGNTLTTARENGRAIRFAITQEVWEALNSAWSEMRSMTPAHGDGSGLSDIVDWVKHKSAIIQGAITGTLMRGDSYDFIDAGMAIERIDSTARLLDVKYHVLLPAVTDVGSAADHYQWLSLLQAAAAQRAYFAETQSDISGLGVAEFLILNDRFPRAILFNLHRAAAAVSRLESFYGRESLCHAAVTDFTSTIANRSLDDIIQFGLHEFLTEIIKRNYQIANLLGQAYGFAPVVNQDDSADDTSEQ